MSTDNPSRRISADEVGTAPSAAAPPEDLAAFQALYADLLRVAAVAAPRGVDPSDIVQQALVKTLASHPDFRGIRNLRAYLYRAVVNVARSSRRQRVGRDEPLPLTEVAAADGNAPVDDNLVDLLEHLSPRQRVCVYLRFVEDRSVAQVAELMGCSEGTVKSQTAKALRTLADRIEQ